VRRLGWSLAAALCVAVIAARAARAADFVWLEGEQPTRQNFQVSGAGWGNAQYLSGEAWLNVSVPADQVEKQVPEDGILLSYDFDAPGAGDYEVWGRIGYEFVRSPFDWRIDEGPWQTVSPEQLTTDMVELQAWNEVAWLQMGKVQLPGGKHTLQVRLSRLYSEANGKKEPQRVLYACDAFCIYKGAFRPNGKFRPDAQWQSAGDKEAAEQVFTFPAGPAPGQRLVLPLDGPWQIARWDEQDVQDRLGPIASPPPADQLYWMGIRVPGDRNAELPQMAYAHRYFYRTRINVPSALGGQSFYLHFPSTNMIATVFVNGVQCGWNKAPLAAWDCDITKAVRPGRINEVWVGIKDTYYAIAPKGDADTRHSFNVPAEMMSSNQGVSMRFDMPVWNHVENGILESPSLVVTGPAYTADVFAMPSVKDKALGLQITLKNPTMAPVAVAVENEVVPLAGGPAEKVFQPSTVTVPARGEQTFTLTEQWLDPRLWWPDDPQQYNVVTRLKRGAETIDTRTTKFGFREWSWDGAEFRLNGVPFHGRADGTGAATPEASVALWKKEGATMFRFWGTGWQGMGMDRTLDFLDMNGVPVRRTGIFDGEAAGYGLTEDVDGKRVPRKALFDNWQEQLTAMVRDERNHPSVFIWSIENEITYINSINFGSAQVTGPAVSAVAGAVMALDPTRPVMVDGGRALADFSLPVNGCHYNDPTWRELPEAAYSMDFLNNGRFHEPWPLKPNAPVFLGEAYFVNGFPASDFSMFGGERAFLGRSEARQGVGILARMMSEGYRWMDLAAFEFLIGDSNSDGSYYTAWQPVAVLCRQWNRSFASGSEVRRTLKVLNDTHSADPISMAWQLVVDGKPSAGESKDYSVAPGTGQEVPISFRVPDAADGTPAELILTCRRGGKEVFRDVKDVHIINIADDPQPALTAGELLVWDKAGSVQARLKARGVPFTEFGGLDKLPQGGKVIVVGPDTLSARDATDRRWQELAGSGMRIVVLDQQQPLHFQAVPANLELSDYSGHVAFAEDLTHPVFRGLGQADFFTWSGDGLVYRNAYRKASSGARSLAQCDDQLGYSALSEAPVGSGLLLLSQFAIGGKLATDAVAERLFDNLLSYAASYQLVQKQTASAVKEGTPIDGLLAGIGLKYDRVSDAAGAVSDGRHQIVVAEADPATLMALAANLEKVKAFANAGGWLVLFDVTPDGLADYDRLVGYDHLIRPFEMERVTLPAVRDPILSGLTTRDVVMESGQRIYSWAGDRFMSNDEFTYILDTDDIAPFSTFPPPAYWHDEGAQPGGDTWPRNMVNGFTRADSWRYCFSIHLDKDDPTQWDLKLPREEQVIGFSIDPNRIYHHVTQVRLTFDGDATGAVTLDLKDAEGMQDFSFAAHPCKVLNIALTKWDAAGTANVIGVDDMAIRVERPKDFTERVKPLLNIGGLIKYPMGKGGILTSQLRILASESVPVNADKKRTIVSALLRNLNATFAAGPQELAPGAALRYTPVPLDDKCNRFLTGADSWFKNTQPRDMAALPRGEGRFAGVDYIVREFKTSPLPSVIVLNGAGAAGVSALPMQVDGIPVDRKVDALFFLQAFNQYARPDARRDRNPVVFQYVIHYADGKTEAVPVRLGLEVDHWISRDPSGLRDAALAWAAQFPNDTSGEQAVLYQMQWNNPRPDVVVQSIDVRYGDSGNSYGQPAMVAITAANVAR
jgi:hypothetical protein